MCVPHYRCCEYHNQQDQTLCHKRSCAARRERGFSSPLGVGRGPANGARSFLSRWMIPQSARPDRQCAIVASCNSSDKWSGGLHYWWVGREKGGAALPSRRRAGQSDPLKPDPTTLSTRIYTLSIPSPLPYPYCRIVPSSQEELKGTSQVNE